MNSIGAIVKILEIPKEKFLNPMTQITCITFRAQLPQIRKNKVITLVVWGNLALQVLNFYKVNDYILIEGYPSIQIISNGKKTSLKKVSISVIKVYPVLLNSSR